MDEIKALAEAGVSIIWLHEREKRPIGADWSEKPTMSWPQLKKTYRDGNNVGVRLGEPSRMDDGLYLHCVDVDIRDPKLAEVALAKLRELFPGIVFQFFPTVKSGSGGESRHYYFGALKAYVLEKARPQRREGHQDAKGNGIGLGKSSFSAPASRPCCRRASIPTRAWLTNGWSRWIGWSDFRSSMSNCSIRSLRSRKTMENTRPGLSASHTSKCAQFVSRSAARQILRGPQRLARHRHGDQARVGRGRSSDLGRVFETVGKVRPKGAGSHLEILQGQDRSPYHYAHDHAGGETRSGSRLSSSLTTNSREMVRALPTFQFSGSRLPRPLPFPTEVFGPMWKRKIEAMARNAGAPVDYVAAAVLTKSSGLIGNSRWVRPTRNGKSRRFFGRLGSACLPPTSRPPSANWRER